MTTSARSSEDRAPDFESNICNQSPSVRSPNSPMESPTTHASFVAMRSASYGQHGSRVAAGATQSSCTGSSGESRRADGNHSSDLPPSASLDLEADSGAVEARPRSIRLFEGGS